MYAPWGKQILQISSYDTRWCESNIFPFLSRISHNMDESSKMLNRYVETDTMLPQLLGSDNDEGAEDAAGSKHTIEDEDGCDDDEGYPVIDG